MKMNTNYTLTLRFPGWCPGEIDDFVNMMKDSKEIEIKSNQKCTSKGTDGVSIESSVISILTPSVTISEIIYNWFQNRKKNNKPVNYMKANNVILPGDCTKGHINQKIRETLSYWR